MITDSMASLTIYSDTHPAAEVTRILGIEPTKIAEKGDPKGRERLGPDGLPARRFYFKTSLWSLKVDVKGESFASLLALADLLEGKAAELSMLRENYRTWIWYYGSSDSDQAGFSFPPEVLTTVAPLGCELQFDIYLGQDYDGGRVIEQVVLPVRAGLEAEFEAAFDEARWILQDMPGCREVVLSRGVEVPNEYLLLVRWDSVEDHEIGFRQSPEYQQWRALLHHFYDPFPRVAHFTTVSRTVL